MSLPALPIDAALPSLLAALAAEGRAVLMAPPGAGKTTGVPLAILAEGRIRGRIVMLEPRRIAARAAAERMAEVLGEPVGGRVGYRIRGEAKVSRETRIEVVTEGILTRMLQSDPELTGIGCVIFDEFHERSLNADLGLALAWEARGALRPDLALLVMSATLDAAPVAAMLDAAPVITAEGRAFPVETRWLDRPADRAQRFEVRAAALVERALAETTGGLLVFLPGEGEIRRLVAMLDGGLPQGCVLRPLYGALPFAAQRAAIRPEPGARKIVLATAIAETSLTIEDVRVVVDCGRARRARFDPATGMARLVTEPVSRAEAEQRRGRAGRVAPGICYRMWAKAEEGALPAFAPPEIAEADLTGLALELAVWGASESDLAFLTPPPAAALAEARALLQGLGALDARGLITAHGRALAALPVHPRLGHMLALAGPAAAPLAALLSDRDPLPGAGADLGPRLAALAAPGRAAPAARGALDRIGAEARRLERLAPAAALPGLSPGAMAALAYPDRIGMRRSGEAPRYLLSGGRGAVAAEGEGLGREPFLVATDLDGAGTEARLRAGLPLAEAELRGLFADRIAWHESCDWSRREGRVRARRQERLGALVLAEGPWEKPPPEALARAARDGLRQVGLTWQPAAARLRDRVRLLAAEGMAMPEVSDAAILADPDDILLPHLQGLRTAADLGRLNLVAVLDALLGWDGRREVDRLAPAEFTTPLGRKVPIDYAGEAPAVALRLQELFGVTDHPVVGPRRRPLAITLLSPAGRPVQVTSDLPGFWVSSYAEVRKEMRGRYPRHPWPEDPTAAAPTLRAKPRGG